MPSVQLSDSFATHFAQFTSEIKINFVTVVKSTVFVVILFALMANLLPSLYYATTEGFGISSLPVTYNMVGILRGASDIFLIAIITFFSGAMIWRERDAKLNDIYAALPFPTWISFLSKFIALIGILVLLFVVIILCGVVTQAVKGYYNFQPEIYATEFLVFDFLRYGFLAVLAMFAHVVAPNKYVGYFLFVVAVIATAFLGNYFEFETRMLLFGSLPFHVYSDFYGFAPYLAGFFWFALYWTLFCAILGAAAILLWQRGRETAYQSRLRNLFKNDNPLLGTVGLVSVAAFIVVGGWVYYNTLVLNKVHAKGANKREDGKFDVTIKVEAQKFRADETGEETEMPIDDFIDIGAFAAPESDKRYGKTLYPSV